MADNIPIEDSNISTPPTTDPGRAEPMPAAPAFASAPPVQAPPQWSAPAPQPPKGLSITSMALGLSGLFLSFFGLGALIVIAAVVTGHLAVKRQPHAKGFWLTGLITGYIGIAFSLIYAFIWLRYLVSLLS